MPGFPSWHLGLALSATKWFGWFPAQELNLGHSSENMGSLAAGTPGKVDCKLPLKI